jgi:Right handed beta helix region
MLLVSSFAMHGAKALQAALDALPDAGGLVVIDQTITLATPLAPPSNTTIQGRPGAVLTIADDGALPLNIIELYEGQSDVTIEDVWFEGGRAAVSGFNCSDITIRNCRVRGARFRGLDFGANTPNLRIERSSFAELHGCMQGIFCEDSGFGVVIEDNNLDTTGIRDHGIALHTFGPGGLLISPRVTRTTVIHGGPNFAIEVGRFGAGSVVTGAVVEGTRILLTAATNGAISFSEVDHGVMANNIVNLNGFAPAIEALELAGAQACLMVGNQVYGGAANSRAAILDSSSDCLIALNHLGGYMTMNNTNAFLGDADMSTSQIVHNRIDVPAGSTAYPAAVYAQVNNPAGEADFNMLASNTISGPDGMAIAAGVVFAGSSEGTVVDSNLLASARTRA